MQEEAVQQFLDGTLRLRKIRALMDEMTCVPLPERRSCRVTLGGRDVRTGLSGIGNGAECRGLAITIEPAA